MPLPGALAGGVGAELPVLPAVPVLPELPELGGGFEGAVLELLPVLLPVLPGELVLPVLVGSDFPQAPNASRELRAKAKAGLKRMDFMGFPFEKTHFKNLTWRANVGDTPRVM